MPSYYQRSGSGMQNISKIPTFITNSDHELFQLVHQQKYDAIVGLLDGGAGSRLELQEISSIRSASATAS
ncbi:hypothetical protein [Paenibacillus piri]|uniref:hypothetical protein n=1 Tax=Paenibacillus piri TaxID=2547395 RepID=UPI001FE88E50|nr:hypothetical protein [Paenibacillus piri]